MAIVCVGVDDESLAESRIVTRRFWSDGNRPSPPHTRGDRSSRMNQTAFIVSVCLTRSARCVYLEKERRKLLHKCK
jgi:hypothetical protein